MPAESILSEPKPALPCLAMRAREAAAALGLSERTLWQLTHDGKVPCIRPSVGIVLYPVDALRRWLDAQAQAQGEGRAP